MIYGYARVSTPDQKLNHQTDALVSAGAEAIFSDEGVSGAKASRPGLDAMLDVVRPGDVVTVWRLDRLGRSVRNLLELAETLKAQGVTIRSLNEGVDTSGTMGGFLLTILGAVAELERETIVDRVKSGMQSAKRRGVHVGRNKSLSPLAREDVIHSIERGERVSDIAKRYRVSRATIYRSVSDTMKDHACA